MISPAIQQARDALIARVEARATVAPFVTDRRKQARLRKSSAAGRARYVVGKDYLEKMA